MMIIFASMLYERRIIFVSKKLYRLSACVQSANGIIYPMNWQHIFIPVLPKHLIDYLLAPMPYLIGLPESLLPVCLNIFNIQLTFHDLMVNVVWYWKICIKRRKPSFGKNILIGRYRRSSSQMTHTTVCFNWN